jgi:predicted nicotinamide N-methyase
MSEARGAGQSYRVRYQTLEVGHLDVHLRTLRDLGQYADDQGVAASAGIDRAGWPLFGMIWPSSQVLARFMLEFDAFGLRILEVGCGLGLTSLVLSLRHADVTATDHHPEVATFLNANAKLNGLEAIPYQCCDWRNEDDDLGRFDLIVGSDLLYRPGQAVLLSRFVNRHAEDGCEIILVGPGRREQASFDRCMLDLGYLYSRCVPTPENSLDEPFRGRIYRYNQRQPRTRFSTTSVLSPVSFRDREQFSDADGSAARARIPRAQ